MQAPAARKDFRVRVVEGEGRCREWTRTLDGNTHKAHDWGKVNIQERRGKGLGGNQVEMKQLDYDVVEEGGYQGLEVRPSMASEVTPSKPFPSSQLLPPADIRNSYLPSQPALLSS